MKCECCNGRRRVHRQRVADQLVGASHEVVVFDTSRKGHRATVPDGARLVVGDLLDGDRIEAALRESGTEAVIHMAASSIVGESAVEPARYYRNNVVAGLSLLDAMRAAGVARLVFSSTAAVYGNAEKQPIEEDDPLAPGNPYGETKLALERAFAWYESAYGLRFASLRYFNAAGATERSGEWHDPETHLIPIVLQVAAGLRDEVTVFGDDYPTPDGTCIRDYIHVADLARAHVLALGMLDTRSAVFNLGCGGSGYSVREVIDVAREVTGREIGVRVGPRREGDPAVLIASSERILRELKWSPERQDLGDIVASAWRWLQEHPHGYDDERAGHAR